MHAINGTPNNIITAIVIIENNIVNTIPIINENISHITFSEKFIYESINSYTPVIIFINALTPTPPSK